MGTFVTSGQRAYNRNTGGTSMLGVACKVLIWGSASAIVLLGLRSSPSAAQPFYGPFNPLNPKPQEYANPAQGIPLGSDISKSFATNRANLTGWTRRSCLTKEERDKLLASAQAEEKYLFDWSRLYAQNAYQQREAYDWAAIIGGLRRDIERMKICPPGETGTIVPPPKPATATPPPVPQKTPDELRCELTGELLPVQERVRRLQDDRDAARGKKEDAEKTLTWINRVKTGQVTKEEAGFKPDDDLTQMEADAKNDINEAQKELDRIVGPDGKSGELKQAYDEETRIRRKFADAGLEVPEGVIRTSMVCPPHPGPAAVPVYASALADGLYAGGKAGWTHLGTVDAITHFEDGGTATDRDRHDEGFDLGGRLGLKQGPWRFEGEFNYRRNGLSEIIATTDPKASGSTQAFTFLGNAIYDFDLAGFPWATPHIGGGIGLAHLQAKQKIAGFTLLNSSDTQFAYQAIAGLRFPLAPNWALDLDYRYLATTDPTYRDIAGNRVTSSYRTHNLIASLTFSFAPPPLPPALPLVLPPPPR